jgi:hypothetical protein
LHFTGQKIETPTPSRFAATPSARSSKYGNAKTELMDLSALNLPERVTADLEELSRHGLADKTWSTYSTAERMLSKFHIVKKRAKKLPLSEKTTLEFIHWLATDSWNHQQLSSRHTPAPHYQRPTSPNHKKRRG